MLQFCQAVQQSPAQLTDFVYTNLTNPDVLPLISQQQFLAKLNLRLIRVEHAQFFIKNIFKIIRNPLQDELKILQQFVKETNNENYRDIALQMINGVHLQKLVFVDILQKIDKGIKSSPSIEVEASLRYKLDEKSQVLMVLLRYIHKQTEQQQWTNKHFRKRLLQLTVEAFDLLEHKTQYSDSFLLTFSRLIHRSLVDQQSQVYLTLFLHRLIQNYKKQVVKIIKNLISFDSNFIFPNTIVSRGVFHLFARFFDSETYYDQEAVINLKQIEQISRQLYEALCLEIQIIELGWLTIFSIDKIVVLESFQQKLHICASILRQAYHGRADTISQIYTMVICDYIQKAMIKDSITKLQSLLTMLTPSQLKYLIFKLSSILSEDKKLQIIQQALKNQSKIMNICTIYFINELGYKIVSQDAVQFSIKFREQYQVLNEQLQVDRYNTYEKQLQHFIKWHMFKVSQQLGLFTIQHNVKLSSLLSFYKHLFENDYFAQQFWVNEQKMAVFMSSDDNDVERIFLFCEFQQNINLSSMMLLTLLLKRLRKNRDLKLSGLCLKTVTSFIEKSVCVIEQDNIPSNLLISFQYILTVIKNTSISIENIEIYFKRLSAVFNHSKWKIIQESQFYGRFNYSIEFLLCKIVGKTKVQIYKHLMPIYRYIIQNSFTLHSNSFAEKMINHYNQIGITAKIKNFSLREFHLKQQLKDIICNYPEIVSLKLAVKKSSEYFNFESPIYKQQIVTFTYFLNDPNDNYYFKNHYLTFLYQEYLKVFNKAVEKSQDRVLINHLFEVSMKLLQEILEGDTYSHSTTFYKSLIKTQNLYILLSNGILSLLDAQQLQVIFDKCLLIIQKDNYPLLRQFLEVAFCRTYLILHKINPSNKNRKKLISMMKVNVNIGVPIALALGYELLQQHRVSNKNKEINAQITEIHQILVKFISCHTAYLRGICQYYLYIYLKLVPPTDPFLINVSTFWSEDKDSQKILANIMTVVEGFKEAVENQCDFLGFERVEEYPSNRVKLQFYRSVSRFYSESILGQINQNQNVSKKFYNAYCDSVQQRSKFIKKQYISLLELYVKSPIERCHKNNMKIKKQQQIKVQKSDKPVKKVTSKKGKGKQKVKNNTIKQEQTKVLIQQDQNLTKFQNLYSIYNELDNLVDWNRKDHSPKVIVIATLLEKVHNFGHILRTLHRKNALLVIPSKLPLDHPECKQLVPQNCDVQVAQIKQRDLQKFIVLMKSLGYPLVALQQCSRSVKVEQAQFPQKFMLLLGNERLGAPAALLNQGDLLVQIPQVGKIRSLNVHVSMVLCLWQYLIKQ